MSEYQYYEFAAIDEPLSNTQMKELRALSTRAEITATSFRNEYQWGDFKGDPRKLIVQYFDAFLYYANWGTRWCMFRLPKAAVDLPSFKAFKTPEAIDVRVHGKHVVVDICLDDEAGAYEVPYDQSLAPLIASRAALLEGDLGPLYVAWLAAVERRMMDDDTPEPCDVSQLPELPAGTRALASFLSVSDQLLKVAYQPAQKVLKEDVAAVAKWATGLTVKDKDTYLTRFITEPAAAVRSSLRKQFRKCQQKPVAQGEPFQRRMAGPLLDRSELRP